MTNGKAWPTDTGTNGHAPDVLGLRPVEGDLPDPVIPEDPFHRLNLRTAIYFALVVLIAGLAIAYFAPDISTDGWQGLLTLTLLAIAFERFGIRIYGDTHVSAGVVALMAIAIIYGAPAVVIAAPVVVFAATLFTPSGWHTRAFDMGSYTLANVCAALVFNAFIDVDGGVSGWWAPAVLAATMVNYSVNIPLVATAVWLRTGSSWLGVWRDEHQWIIPYYIVFGLLGFALSAGYLAVGIPGIFAFVAPPLMMRFALQQYVSKTEQTVLELKQKNAQLEAANESILQMTDRLTETYDGTLEALVSALDARDRETKGHSFRVASYVLSMARTLGVPEGTHEWTDMYRGALLHDVGKIGVPDSILHKPGPLTPEEWDSMKRHPDIGHDMLREISFLSGAASIVHAHHERFDGKGYPRGMAGDEIPIGARIFTIADAFDAMTSDRPYRKALKPEMAREEIVRHSGTQFDPQAVQAFLLVYEEMEHNALARDHDVVAHAA
ncbi:MAG: HD-GYP domain-containing protein [Dehalococcoidia bacterium]